MEFKYRIVFISILLSFCYNTTLSQHISEFESLAPDDQNTDFRIPTSHIFQYVIEEGDLLSDGNILPDRCDFAGFVPLEGSSKKGVLSINSEDIPGGVTMMDIEFDDFSGVWKISNSQKVDFSLVGGTHNNCSGTVTPWNTIITCEERSLPDSNGDGYRDMGWAIEIDPVTRKVIDQPGDLVGADKLWAMGNFKHENAVVHLNKRTVYEGVDDSIGYLYRFIADEPEKLSKGKLFVYRGSKEGNGEWVLIKNSTIEERNSTLWQSGLEGATVFDGIEDVEISPSDSMIYFTVKGEGRVYRFKDVDPLNGTKVENFETYVGGTSYDIETSNSIITEDWSLGNDNLAFDNQGNLWVFQDGGKNYIWVVGKEHSQVSSDVRIFGKSPLGSEPTGITFTPDNKFLFMSIQHPDSTNSATSIEDAFGISKAFDKDVTLVIARKENIGNTYTSINQNIPDVTIELYPNPATKTVIINNPNSNIHFIEMKNELGETLIVHNFENNHLIELQVKNLCSGLYIISLKIEGHLYTKKIVIK